MTITRYEAGGRMAQAVVHNDTIYLAGQVGHGATVAEQTTDALEQVERLLELSGGQKETILSVQIWLADMNDFDEMNAVYDAWLDTANMPTRAAGESRLATPDYLVEFIVVAATA